MVGSYSRWCISCFRSRYGFSCGKRYRDKLKTLDDLKRVRREFRAVSAEPGPVLICANHLTMIDSVIMMWAFAGPWTYWCAFSRLCWNVPARENFAHSFWQRWVTYLAKCLPIDRQGSREHLDGIFENLRELLRAGEYVMLFPEGTRSRTGRFRADEITYGVGRLVQAVPECRVLCVYLRGARQDGHSDLPVRGETFFLDLRLIAPDALAAADLANDASGGLRVARDVSRCIATELERMEGKYFAGGSGAGV